MAYNTMPMTTECSTMVEPRSDILFGMKWIYGYVLQRENKPNNTSIISTNNIRHQLVYNHDTCNANAAMPGQYGIPTNCHCHERTQYNANDNDNGIRP
jgi:hypothetical protein